MSGRKSTDLPPSIKREDVAKKKNASPQRYNAPSFIPPDPQFPGLKPGRPVRFETKLDKSPKPSRYDKDPVYGTERSVNRNAANLAAKARKTRKP